MKQIHIIYGSVLAALLVIVPTTIVLAQMQVLSDLSIASVNVSQDPITHGSDQEVSVTVVDNSADDAPAAGVDVMLTVSYASGMERSYTQITDQNGNADFVFPIDASSKPEIFNIVAEIPGSNISEDESFEVIPTTTEGDSERHIMTERVTTSEEGTTSSGSGVGTTSEEGTTSSGSGVGTTSEEGDTTSSGSGVGTTSEEGDTTSSGSGVGTTSEGDSEGGTTSERNREVKRFTNRGGSTTGSTTSSR